VPLSIIISLFLLLKIVLHFANGIMPSCDDIDDDESHSTCFEYHRISQEESLAQKFKQQKLSNNQARPDPPPTHPASALCRAPTRHSRPRPRWGNGVHGLLFSSLTAPTLLVPPCCLPPQPQQRERPHCHPLLSQTSNSSGMRVMSSSTGRFRGIATA